MRIKSSEGEVVNISKSWTLFYGGFFCFLGYSIFNNNPQVFIDFIIGLVTYCLSYAGIRGVFYDPSLNVMRGKNIDYVSSTTNSKIDGIERSINLKFWKERALYAVVAVVFTVIYAQLK